MQTRKHYTKQFKLEAVRLLEQTDKPAAEVARGLRVRRNQLYKWKQALAEKGDEGVFRGQGRNAATEQLSEHTALKRRLTQLEEQNAILKKAAAYFTRYLP